MGNNHYTENFADIIACERERNIATDTLVAWREHGLPSDFQNLNTRFALNRNSGFVFLVNDDYEVAILADNGKLESYYTTPYNAFEGSLDDLLDQDHSNWHQDDITYLLFVMENRKLQDDERYNRLAELVVESDA